MNELIHIEEFPGNPTFLHFLKGLYYSSVFAKFTHPEEYKLVAQLKPMIEKDLWAKMQFEESEEDSD